MATQGAQMTLFLPEFKPITGRVFNTNHMSAEQIKHMKAVAGRQCQQIMDFMRGNPNNCFTPFEVQEYAGMADTPITSIRRALNTLTMDGYLVKTEIMKPGAFGVMNHTWKVR